MKTVDDFRTPGFYWVKPKPGAYAPKTGLWAIWELVPGEGWYMPGYSGPIPGSAIEVIVPEPLEVVQGDKP